MLTFAQSNNAVEESVLREAEQTLESLMAMSAASAAEQLRHAFPTAPEALGSGLDGVSDELIMQRAATINPAIQQRIQRAHEMISRKFLFLELSNSWKRWKGRLKLFNSDTLRFRWKLVDSRLVIWMHK